MSEGRYQVVMTGNIKTGVDQGQAIEQLAAAFRLAPDQAEGLLKGNETIIKRDIDRDTAAQYHDALVKAGVETRVEDLSGNEVNLTEAPASDGEITQPTEPVSATDAAAAFASVSVNEPDGPSNPYAPPSANVSVDEDQHAGGVHGPQSVGAFRGITWLKQGAGLVFSRFGVWLGMWLVFALIYIAISIIPLLGAIASSLLFAVFTGGFMYAAHHQMTNGEIQFSDLFDGFKNHFGPLVGVGAVYLGGMIALSLVAVLVVLVVGAFIGQDIDFESMAAGGDATFVVLIIGAGILSTLLFLPLVVMVWFAPALIKLDNVPLGQALAWGFRNFTQNWLTFIIYGITIALLFVLSAITFGLALLIVGPVMTASIYFGYRDVFRD